jgi:hypothetical protein
LWGHHPDDVSVFPIGDDGLFETELDESGLARAESCSAVEEYDACDGLDGAEVKFDLGKILERLSDLGKEGEFGGQV